MRHPIRATASVVLSLTLAVSLSLVTVNSAQAGTSPRTASTESGLAPAAVRKTAGKALLGKLRVRTEKSKGYKRIKFGEDWLDVDADCQNTRSEVLQDESQAEVTFYSPRRRCAVATGRWTSWYDNTTWTQATAVEVDHLVALSEAWRSGARTWTKNRRLAYANDLGFTWTLDAITRDVNQDKSGYDPSEWLPEKNRCAYARHWVAVKYRWGLSIDKAEKKALSKLLTGKCGSTKLTVPTRVK